MKESEAKEKWCPMSRVVCSPNEPAYNRLRDGDPSSAAKCIGSDCMMWQTTSDKSSGWCGLTR